ncbi:MAG: hypothetical protein WKF71_13510 [Pyrinomonadaceae bacterium]
MKTGDIILIPFPFAELTNKKVRPAVVVCETKDVYKDLVLCGDKFGCAVQTQRK